MDSDFSVFTVSCAALFLVYRTFFTFSRQRLLIKNFVSVGFECRYQKANFSECSRKNRCLSITGIDGSTTSSWGWKNCRKGPPPSTQSSPGRSQPPATSWSPGSPQSSATTTPTITIQMILRWAICRIRLSEDGREKERMGSFIRT